ncbi:MAG: SUMF1/EgtB/PvdO family nonheme iron enzyme [Planctomycetota bacterium]
MGLLLPAHVPAGWAADAVPEWAQVSDQQKTLAQELGIPVAFEDDWGMRFVLVPGGTFTMGAPRELDWRASRPLITRAMRHQVTLSSPYYMQVTELTMAQAHALAPDSLGEENNEEAIGGLSWSQATELAETATNAAMGARTYRLPTEAEWERAARGGADTNYYWGSSRDAMVEHAKVEFEKDSTWTVARFKPNPFGLYDVCGNASEWVQDRAGPTHSHAVTDPMGLDGVSSELHYLLDAHIVRGSGGRSCREQGEVWRRWMEGSPYGPEYAGVRFVVDVPGRRDPRLRAVQVTALAAEDGSPLGAGFTLHHHDDRLEQSPSGLFLVRPRIGRSYRVDVEIPPGRVAWTGAFNGFYPWFRDVPGSREFQFHVPLYAAARVQGRVMIPKGLSADDISVRWISLGDESLGRYELQRLPPVVGIDAKGRFAFDDVPWIPGAPVEITATSSDGKEGTIRANLPKNKPHLEIAAALRLAEVEPEEDGLWEETFGSTEGLRPPPLYPTGFEQLGSTVIRVVDARGRPLSGAAVVRGPRREDDGDLIGVGDVAITDESGDAYFPIVPSGTHVFELHGLPMPPASIQGDIKQFEETRLTMQVPEPGQLDLTVVRAEGGPAAWASLVVRQASGRTWYDLAPDGVLRVNSCLDHAGRHTLRNLSPGRLTLHVRLLGRSLRHELVIETGVTRTLELTLEEAEHWTSGARK